MKSTLPFILLILSLCFGCNTVDELTVQDFNAPLEKEFLVSTADSLFDTTAVFDAAANKDFLDHKSRIESVELKGVAFEIIAFDNSKPGDTLKTGKVEFLNTVTGGYELLSEIRDMPLKKTNQITNLAFDPIVAAKLANSYKADPYKATVRLSSRLNRKGTHFTMALTVTLKVKIKA